MRFAKNQRVLGRMRDGVGLAMVCTACKMHLSAADCEYLAIGRFTNAPQTPTGRSYQLGLPYLKPLCPPYLQTLATPLVICDHIGLKSWKLISRSNYVSGIRIRSTID